MGKTLLNVEDISISFGGLKAVDELSFKINEGEIHGLIGPNGAGKTTVFNIISQFYKLDSGKVIFNDKNISKLKVYKVINEGITRTFQNVELFKNMTVKDNLLVGYHHAINYSILASILKLPKVKKQEQEVEEKINNVLEFLGIEEYKDFYVSNLPYGVQKLVELGRALISNPKFLILDEPAAGMNDLETKELGERILKIRNEQGVTVLLVEHDMALVMKICDRITAINFGKKIAEGTPKEVQNNPVVIEAYLGEGVQ